MEWMAEEAATTRLEDKTKAKTREGTTAMGNSYQ